MAADPRSSGCSLLYSVHDFYGSAPQTQSQLASVFLCLDLGLAVALVVAVCG